MQLKMQKPAFNINKIKQILIEENNFITDLFGKLPVPNQSREEEDVDLSTNSHNLQNKFPSATTTGQPVGRAKSLEELQSRIQALKERRSLSYKDKLLRRSLKSHIKKKIKKDERLKLGKTVVHVPKAGEIKNEDGENEPVKPAKPVFNSQGKMVFSKFDFSNLSNKKNKKKVDTDPQKILEKLSKNKEKLKSLTAEGETERAQQLQEKAAWKSALAKAEGQKVKDDPELLKKSIKKQEQLKRVSAKKWQVRQEGVKKAQDERQRKREANINKRKNDKKNKKIKKAVKKGRIIPGF